MSPAKSVLIIHPAGDEAERPARELRDALRALGAEVTVHAMTDRYNEVLDAIERTDAVVVWK